MNFEGIFPELNMVQAIEKAFNIRNSTSTKEGKWENTKLRNY